MLESNLERSVSVNEHVSKPGKKKKRGNKHDAISFLKHLRGNPDVFSESISLE